MLYDAIKNLYARNFQPINRVGEPHAFNTVNECRILWGPDCVRVYTHTSKYCWGCMGKPPCFWFSACI